jgi:hypothetical protein
MSMQSLSLESKALRGGARSRGRKSSWPRGIALQGRLLVARLLNNFTNGRNILE